METPAHSGPLLETADDTDLLLETAGGTDEQSAVGLVYSVVLLSLLVL